MAEQPIDRIGAARSPSARRSLLRASLGAGAAAFVAGRAMLARAEDASPPGDPEWSQSLGPGIGDRVYGKPSDFEADVIRRNVPWLTANGVVLVAVSITTVWRNLGFTFIIYLGGLSSLPPEVLEAADIDGAAGFQKLWRVILPLLSPTILFAVVTDAIKMLQFFDEPFIMTRGGPGDASRTVVMMMYDSAFGNLEFGYGSAIALSLFLIIMIITGIQFYLSRRWVFYK